MMGIIINEPSFAFGYNQSMFFNTYSPLSTLKKKSSSIALHLVCEVVANN